MSLSKGLPRKINYMHSEVGCKGFAPEGKCSVLYDIWLKRQIRDIGLAIQFDDGNAIGNGHFRMNSLCPWSAMSGHRYVCPKADTQASFAGISS